MFKKIAVLGAGHGGHAMSAELSMVGYEVNLYEIPEFADNIKPIIEKGGINVIARRPPAEEYQLPAGGKTGFAKITGKVTSDIKEALDGVDLIMLVVPAFGRERFIRECAPYLHDGQTIVIWPGYFGSVQCANLLKSMGVDKDILIVETESLIYACKRIGPAQVLIKDFKRKLLTSALPAGRTNEALEMLEEIYPQLTPAKNILETTFSNVNPVLHPPSVLVNLHRVEAKFYPYYEEIGGPLVRCYDVTPGMARVMEAVDKERLAITDKLGLKLLSLKDTLSAFYLATGKDLYETILNVPTYQKQTAPTSLNHRYVIEDAPFGLVPFALFGDQFQVPTPTIRALVTIACATTGKDYWSEGLTMEKLGLAGKTAKEIMEYAEAGVWS
ncbi:MAG: NAD/NADP octopine/nopaline dehydrogenase family protein [Dehalococcoidia bacterium]|nr:NAD/NADP octopine/nopaline dehydrogenase family protein [Dehalococcoidia bacterium]MDH5781680.1 NAD/NADP octopine/nopaline dehydrogenase family protein [Dehalococcoidia bacterium]